ATFPAAPSLAAAALQEPPRAHRTRVQPRAFDSKHRPLPTKRRTRLARTVTAQPTAPRLPAATVAVDKLHRSLGLRRARGAKKRRSVLPHRAGTSSRPARSVARRASLRVLRRSHRARQNGNARRGRLHLSLNSRAAR